LLSIDENSIIYAITNPETLIDISNSTFKNVFSEKSAIKLILSHIRIQNVHFHGIYGKMSANFLTVMYSDAVLNSITFNNSNNDLKIAKFIIEGSDLGLLDLNYNSKIIVTDAKLYGIRASKEAILKTSKESVVVINGSTYIENCTSGLLKVGISLTQANQFEISDTTFVNSNGIYIEYMIKNHFKIDNIKFIDNKLRLGLVVYESVGKLKNSNFEKSTKFTRISFNAHGSTVLIEGDKFLTNIEIDNCTFSNQSSIYGGAIDLKKANSVEIKNSLF